MKDESKFIDGIGELRAYLESLPQAELKNFSCPYARMLPENIRIHEGVVGERDYEKGKDLMCLDSLRFELQALKDWRCMFTSSPTKIIEDKKVLLYCNCGHYFDVKNLKLIE